MARTSIQQCLRACALGAVVSAALGLSAAPARAAGDGALGATSSGTVDLDVSVPNLVRISMLDDVDLGTYAGANMTGFEQFCVFSSTGSYRVTATSAHGVGNRFYLDNAGATLRYIVRWYDSNNFQRNLRNNQQSPTFDATASAIDCAGVTNTRLRIRVRNAWAGSAAAGVYSDTLTLLVQPQ